MSKQKDKERLNAEFGEFIRAKRMALNLTQEDVAASIGIDFQSVSRIERGSVTPTLYTCYCLADALDIPLPKLLEEFAKKKK
jgi:transcriptional regulator with XRE-family HTH domain